MSQKKKKKKKGQCMAQWRRKKNKGNLKDVHIGIFVN